jgi:hypothetical protein
MANSGQNWLLSSITAAEKRAKIIAEQAQREAAAGPPIAGSPAARRKKRRSAGWLSAPNPFQTTHKAEDHAVREPVADAPRPKK